MQTKTIETSTSNQFKVTAKVFCQNNLSKITHQTSITRNIKNESTSKKVSVINDSAQDRKDNFYFPDNKVEDNLSVKSLLILKHKNNIVGMKASNF